MPHDDPRVQEIVDRSRKFISDNFYECSLEALSGLGKMYVADERFTAYYEKYAPGLAAYYNDAIQYYYTKRCRDASGRPDESFDARGLGVHSEWTGEDKDKYEGEE
ncbi:TipAS antibiotic-recognition domain-containing protein [Pelotomaculum propionicicum]|uniref:HTH-type transcriptional activator mta n=1 Tax=Pelotomaculum propionicicum TaxID=258475 RepID=A0A4Y7RXS4_9FIRM|nr:TipAS antibiotic-recognition domain-containing protein [Pelotomaculum propionicicum]TEB13774.1 HTH-type transcriptional activator mta [Pelotomaculum propionicicum]